MKHYFTFLAFSFPLLLCACAPFKFDDHRAAVCNELNSRIIFNGATGDTRRSEIQSSETPLAEHNYDKRCEK